MVVLFQFNKRRLIWFDNLLWFTVICFDMQFGTQRYNSMFLCHQPTSDEAADRSQCIHMGEVDLHYWPTLYSALYSNHCHLFWIMFVGGPLFLMSAAIVSYNLMEIWLYFTVYVTAVWINKWLTWFQLYESCDVVDLVSLCFVKDSFSACYLHAVQNPLLPLSLPLMMMIHQTLLLHFYRQKQLEMFRISDC